MNRVVCGRCAAPYRPDLTGWSCPVCDTAPPEGVSRPLPRVWDDSDNRLTAIVLLGTVLNVLLLAALAAVVLAR